VPLARALGGWQQVFLVYGVATLAALVWAVGEFRRGRAARRAAPPARARPDRPLPARGVLVLAALGAALGVGPMTVVASFLVLAGVAAGIDAVRVGLTLALGSAVAIVLRVTFGLVVDARIARGRTTGAPALMVGVLVLSAAGLAQMDASVTWRFGLGAVVGLGLGWAWHGLLDLSVVRLYADDAARATGISQIGAYVGGIAGPLGGGLLFEAVGAGPLWLLCAVACLGAAAAFGAAARRAARAPELVAM
jgi:predicted MFS family arabinose efflux permease